MTISGRFVASLLCVLAAVATSASPGRAGLISSGPGLEGLGSFTGSFDYIAVDSSHAILTVQLSNTSSSGGGGYLTAFAFDDPYGRVTGVTLGSTNPNFQLLGGTGESGSISAPPFGHFDIGASSSGSFLGGGSPVGGIEVGDNATFIFTLSGDDLDDLTADSFFGSQTLSPCDPPSVAFIARFRGFVNGGSDKVPGVCPPVPDSPPPVVNTPEPGALTLAAVALVLGCGRRVRSRERRSADR